MGQLKELGSTGALTSQQVITALEGQSAALQQEFDQLPKTVSTAFAVLTNSWTQYVSQANQATGATTTAAAGIEALARNLPIVAEVLYGVGKAALAYTAVKLGAAFLEAAAGARAAAAATATATAATTAHTAATVANTAAQGANAAATATSAASAGRFASIISGIKLGGLLLVLTNLKEIGTAIGEGAAKWMGYGKAIEDAERYARAEAETTRRNAAEKAELAQRTQQAADAALPEPCRARQWRRCAAQPALKGGKTQSLTALNPRSSPQLVKTQPTVVALIDKLLDAHTYSEIADLLNDQGVRPGGAARTGRAGARFTSLRVGHLANTYGLRSRYDRLRDRGLLTKEEAAARLDIHEQTLVRWAVHGLITRHAYNGHAYLYEEPSPGLPMKHCSRWDRLVDRTPVIDGTPGSMSSHPSGRGAV